MPGKDKMSERERKAFERAKELPKGGPIKDVFMFFEQGINLIPHNILRLNNYIRMLQRKYDEKKDKRKQN